jgi:hypothetical protein
MTKKMMKNFTDLKSGYEVSQFLFVESLRLIVSGSPLFRKREHSDYWELQGSTLFMQ